MRAPKPVTATRVNRWTDWYLERWSTTEANLKRILWRKANRSLAEHGGDKEEVAGWIDDAVARVRRYGWVDDARYAADVIRSQRRKGKSVRAIRRRLIAKGVDRDLLDGLLADEHAGAEHEAAWQYARKRGIGPWRREEVDASGRQRELARLARAGFGFDIARQIVDAESPPSI